MKAISSFTQSFSYLRQMMMIVIIIINAAISIQSFIWTPNLICCLLIVCLVKYFVEVHRDIVRSHQIILFHFIFYHIIHSPAFLRVQSRIRGIQVNSSAWRLLQHIKINGSGDNLHVSFIFKVLLQRGWIDCGENCSIGRGACRLSNEQLTNI